MKKIVILAAMAAMTLASCQKNESFSFSKEEVSDAISFTTYGARMQTKATSPMDLDSLKKKGFGVFAFYNGQTEWASYTGTTPDFMKNQQVLWDETTSAWTYEPVKYWPNNPNDKVSFFAYAPYDETKVWSDNTIAYTVNSDVKKQIDLLWCAGKADQTRQADSVKFAFNHALARIGFKVKYNLHSGDTDEIDGTKTTIEVKSVTLQKKDAAAGIFYASGNLDLTATTSATWSNPTGAQSFTLSSTNKNFEDVYKKVTSTATKLNKDDSYIMIIPQKTTFDVKIIYTVKTIDTGLDAGYSLIENTITTNVPQIDFKANSSYSLNLIIGINAVEVSATVDDWTDAGSTDVEVPSVIS